VRRNTLQKLSGDPQKNATGPFRRAIRAIRQGAKKNYSSELPAARDKQPLFSAAVEENKKLKPWLGIWPLETREFVVRL